MDHNLRFVANHGYLVLFLWVLAEQAGLPVPSLPILLASGAMAANGHLNLAVALLLAVTASMIADSIWYQLGRSGGVRVLNFLCKMSLEPQSCVRRTELAFSKRGLRSLLFAKFVPGLSTAAPPLAGVFRLSRWKFLLFDSLGALLWAGAYIGLGAAFSKQIEMVERRITQVGGSLLTAGIIALAIYLTWKLVKRHFFIRELRTFRITPAELKTMMDAGEEIVVVDLRHPMEFEAAPYSILGALRMSPEELSEKHSLIPRDRDVILFCT